MYWCAGVGLALMLNSVLRQPLVRFGWFLMFWKALDVLVNSLYWTQAPLLTVDKCKSCEFALVSRPCTLRANSEDSFVVLFLRTVRRNCSNETRFRLCRYLMPMLPPWELRRTNSLSGRSAMPISEAVRLFPAPFVWRDSANSRWLVAVPPG